MRQHPELKDAIHKIAAERRAADTGKTAAPA
jgi:hypothetical protein